MFLLDGAREGGASSTDSPGRPQDLVYSASDLVIAAHCEYQLLRKLDERLGRSTRSVFAVDAMLARTAQLGDVHEHRVLDGFVSRYGAWNPVTAKGVYDVAPAASMDRATLQAKHDESIAALQNGADVVFQAAFFDGTFHGRSDFLVRNYDGTYAVFDTKLARHAKVSALLQLAAYADQLRKAGITPSPAITLVLGDGRHSDHQLADVLPVFRERRTRFLAMTAAHRAQERPVRWADSQYTACGHCDYCVEQVQKNRDLLLVAGMTMAQRQKLQATGISTIDQLAAIPADRLTGLSPTVARLREQAQFQTGTAVPDGVVSYLDKEGLPQTISYRVLENNTLGRLPRPDSGDIFFDFEGDPLWQDAVTGRWGLEYLFGVIEAPLAPDEKPVFRPFWAHNRAEEKRAFLDFLSYVAERRRAHPAMRIYHYATYEKTALRNLSLTHLAGEDAVDALLREGVLVDLYETVRHSLRISADSYSIKKLEPLYMGTTLRSGDVTDAGASVVAYADYCAARDAAETEDATDAEKDSAAALAARILAGIRDYNAYDCLSTLRLRDWLLSVAAARGTPPAGTPAAPDDEDGDGGGDVNGDGNGDGNEDGDGGGNAADSARHRYEPSAEEANLQGYLAALPAGKPLTAQDQAVAMVAAAVGYHRREEKQFWWGHFDRLNQPLAAWEQHRDVFTVDRAEVVEDWVKPTSRSNAVRTLRLSGHLADGSVYAPGKTFFRMYEPPFPEALERADDGMTARAGWFATQVLEVSREAEEDVLLVRERLHNGAEEHRQLPFALTPECPIGTDGQKNALTALAAKVGVSLPFLPADPALDLLQRRPPRLKTLTGLPAVGEGPEAYADAITATVADLDRSYLAVQGPPGTGKTHVGPHVIANLVARGWKVGVVAQSHAVVENLLRAAIRTAGVSADRVAKKVLGTSTEVPWSGRSDDAVAGLLARPGGCLVGGTAWTMTGSKVAADSLDLLVIDEAGQFSLANTMAVSRVAPRLLLLGDPQQLPQVTQGKHPEPVDESALGWLSPGVHTLPAELGYFLSTSWRIHPYLCAAVSDFSYDGRLRSAPSASLRHLAGVPAGVACVLIRHSGNSTSSGEEAAEVIRQTRAHLGLAWLDRKQTEVPRPLEQEDILVVAAYNAQVQLIARELGRAGLGKVRVGTVDKFQGQEAPVVIVSIAVSAAGDIPRGIEFLLSRNRINVAVSRGQWRAVIIRSPELTNYLPVRPEGLAQLGGFIALCERAASSGNGARATGSSAAAP
ncbi:TM0106 family RecB-like putative nuclease [Arthrobacter sp. H14-L1]|uniref:TM0106 family RecB-like putative nuclease n=1 Tax=Arthrobacter sp. H14-L1 TaxID=2996697 RepID=UPI00226FC2DF|nr:bifunctional RecB family nuclease/DEAD/DEAH box helicase [Arthrobacter sp. H14-L1]MCY0905889.1 TM0106 family RecB-like putative nuclease [Arthrobacter sp. H14-L1]